MWSLKDELMKQEQYKDLLRDAENRALVRQALMEQQRRAPSGGWRVAALVRRLVNLGCSLLERYASALKVTVLTPCQEASTNQPSYPEGG